MQGGHGVSQWFSLFAGEDGYASASEGYFSDYFFSAMQQSLSPETLLPAGEDGYASASEGYFSATESVSSMRSGRSFGKDNSFSGPRAGLGASGRRASGADSDSDDEVRRRAVVPCDCAGSCSSWEGPLWPF
jgi:hypothetical protein